MANLSLQLNDYRLTTAEILYHLPDHPALLQSFIWQNYDIAPRYPELHRFLDFWSGRSRASCIRSSWPAAASSAPPRSAMPGRSSACINSFRPHRHDRNPPL
jgi:uncharacterized protein Usg